MRCLKILFCVLIVFSFHALPQEKNSPVKDSISSLIQKFSDRDPFVRGDAVTLVVKLGSAAVGHLVIALNDKNDDTRLCSAIALGRIAPQGAKSITYLVEALKDKNPDVRWCSAIALGKFRTDAESAVAPLLAMLNDSDRDTRWAAYTALLKINKASINKTREIGEVIRTIETLTPQLMKELRVPGVSISIIKDHKLAWIKSFGFSDAAEKKPVDNNTMFEACSMSKPVFAFIVLKLVEQGILELDKPLYDYLPEEFVGEDDDFAKMITARMILIHTSGMPNWRRSGDETGGPLPVYFKPGTRFNYSGEGMFYLQRVIEHLTKKPLETLAKESLFDKLGFLSTGYTWTPEHDRQIATGHDTSGVPKERSKYTHANAAYTLCTTPEEYAKFIIEIMKHDNTNGVSLSGKTVNEMVRQQVRVDTREVTDRPGRALGLYSFRGLGWGIDSTITGDIIYHSGSNQSGFRCYSQFRMDEGSGIVIMTNGANGSELWTRIISKVGDL